MKILILADIHGNLSALDAVLKDAERFKPDCAAQLGDIIDYGMRSNEVTDRLHELSLPVVCSLWGNHEHSVMTGDYTRFSSERGRVSAAFTKSRLSENTLRFLNDIPSKNGFTEFTLEGKSFLAVHGSLEDCFWKSVFPYSDLSGYSKYDYVLSGHSHLAHSFPIFHRCDSSLYRNKKRTVFINPGSVGQPRNHDPRAQYAVLDTDGDVYLCGAEYDIKYEMSLFGDDTDHFYRDRLERGI